MAKEFLRDYELTIFNPEELIENLSTEFIPSTASEFTLPAALRGVSGASASTTPLVDFRTVARNATSWKDLQISCDIKNASRSMADTPPTSTITIYNLSDSSISKIKPTYTLKLSAGYKSTGIGTIFNGTILNVITTRAKGGDTMTKMVCSDSKFPMKYVRGSVSFPPEVTPRNVIHSLLSLLSEKGIPTGRFHAETEVTGFVPEDEREFTLPAALRGVESYTHTPRATVDAPYKNGYSFEGNVWDELRRVCESIKYRCSVRLGKIYVEQDIQSSVSRQLLILDPAQIVAKTSRWSDQTGEEAKSAPSGIKITTVLSHESGTADTLRITSGTHKGDWQIKGIEHKMKFIGGDWVTIIKALPISNKE